jgi:hypothetical protein
VTLRDDGWQEAVWHQMHRCPFVVAILGDTPGFMWEISALLRSGALDRTIFVSRPSVGPSAPDG